MKRIVETDAELDARILALNEKIRDALKELRAAERKRRQRTESHQWHHAATKLGFATVSAWRKASPSECALIQKLQRMTVADGCTHAEADVDTVKLRALAVKLNASRLVCP